METEKISEQNRQQHEIENPSHSEKHIKAVGEEQEQVKELLRRGSIRHYFMGPENVWTQEGFGTVVGGGLTVFFGAFLLPKLFLYSSNSKVLLAICGIMTVIGILICGKGLYAMIKEFRRENKPVPDRVYDEVLEHDIADLKKTSKKMLEENIPGLKEEGSIDNMEMLLVKGPRDYVANVNLPLVWKLGDDGTLRYSNFSVMALYFGKEIVYIYTCIFNMRNGMGKFHHTYECPYDQIRFVGFEDRIVEAVTQNNKAVVQNLKMLVIDAGDGENETLSMPVADYDMIKKYNGRIDNSDAEAAVNVLLEKMKGVIVN